MDQIMSV